MEKELKVIAREAFFIRKEDITGKEVSELMKRHTHLFFREGRTDM